MQTYFNRQAMPQNNPKDTCQINRTNNLGLESQGRDITSNIRRFSFKMNARQHVLLETERKYCCLLNLNGTGVLQRYSRHYPNSSGTFMTLTKHLSSKE